MEIEGILFLIILFGIPVMMLVASVAKILPVKSKLKLALISFFILYAFIVGSTEVVEYQIRQELYTFDLDGNGSFSPEEITPEAKVAMDRFSHDTGRTFAPITGFIFSFIYALIFFTAAHLISKYVPKHT